LKIAALPMGFTLFVFAVVALSGPGRIDIADGQARYEVARSLVDHGDTVIRDPQIWFGRFPGRAGKDYTTYRLPQSILGVAAIWLADATAGFKATEERRHFFFSLTGAIAAAAIGCAYLVWFRRSGLSDSLALAWSLAGIICTPFWFYATSTFDDALGASAIICAIVAAREAREQDGLTLSIVAGLFLGLAFNCKQPLGAFAFAVLAAGDQPKASRRHRLVHASAILAGLGVGTATYLTYDWYKFPPETSALRCSLLARYTPPWPGHPLTALAAMAISPAAGTIWYFPAVLLSAVGFRRASGTDRYFALTALGGSITFTAFISTISFFKGDPSWGPRYLTPVFSVVWLFAPVGASRFGRRWSAVIMSASLAVQLASLAVDPHRLYIARNLPSAFGATAPVLYFDPRNSHLINRPGELIEIWRARHAAIARFSPAASATSALPIIDEMQRGPEAIGRYRLLQTFRPWWASQLYLSPSEQPVPIRRGVAVLLIVLVAGLLLGTLGLRARTHSPS
jgi:hypothetical protein